MLKNSRVVPRVSPLKLPAPLFEMLVASKFIIQLSATIVVFFASSVSHAAIRRRRIFDGEIDTAESALAPYHVQITRMEYRSGFDKKISERKMTLAAICSGGRRYRHITIVCGGSLNTLR